VMLRIYMCLQEHHKYIWQLLTQPLRRSCVIGFSDGIDTAICRQPKVTNDPDSGMPPFSEVVKSGQETIIDVPLRVVLDQDAYITIRLLTQY
jgi:hypothetical protein